MNDEAGDWWAVVGDDEERHVVPWDPVLREPARAHTPDVDCWCGPTPLPRGVADDDVDAWTHHEAGWPGSSEKLQ